MDHIPLSHEPSAGDCNKQTTSTLPAEVDNCLVNARFVSLFFPLPPPLLEL
jgi:hypothetical protein